MTQSKNEVLQKMVRECTVTLIFICAVTYLYVPCLPHMCRDSSIRDVTQSKNEVLQKLVRECTLIVWPLMKMRTLKEESLKDAATREEVSL